MLQPKLRRAVASAALLSALSLLPVDAAFAARAPRSQRSQAPAAAPAAGTFWELFTRLLSKVGLSINPDGRDARLSTDSTGNRAGDLEGSH